MPVVFDRVTADVQNRPSNNQNAQESENAAEMPSQRDLVRMRQQLKRLQYRAARLQAD